VDSEHCALWAANTLKEAIRDYLAMKKERGRRLIANVESGWR
jgi:NifU-like protein involved in Fe-S cluster formation